MPYPWLRQLSNKVVLIIFQMYGSEHMMTLNNLERLGLLEESSHLASLISPGQIDVGASFLSGSGGVKKTVAAMSMAYPTTLRRSLRLQPASNQQPVDQSLDAFLGRMCPSGAIPISVRLVQAMALGWPTTARVNPIFASSVASSALQAGRRFVTGVTYSSNSCSFDLHREI